MAVLARVLAPVRPGPGVALIAGAGIAGMLADSALGATIQGVYECAACGARWERGDAACHEPLRRVRGWRWVDNDAVNLAATLVGAGAVLVGR
jgi:uncharacterized membrane protein